MTKQFPPDFTLIKNNYNLIRNLQNLSHRKSNPVVPIQQTNASQILSDDDEIEQLIQQRQKLLLPLDKMAESLREEAPNAVKSATCQNQDILVHQLKIKIDELDQQNLSLNKQILQLRYNKK